MKFKQLAAVGLVTAMVFSAAGCSSKSQQTESSAAQAEKTPENSQEKAQGGEPVEIVYLNSHADVWEGMWVRRLYRSLRNPIPESR